MKTALLTLRDLRYGAPELHIEMHASNGSTSGTQDFYCYVEDLEEFARELSSFPSSITSEATLEAGKRDRGWAHFVRVRAFVYDRVGHSALEIDLASHADEPHGAAAHFFILCEPASLNRLGKNLLDWCGNRDVTLVWEPTA